MINPTTTPVKYWHLNLKGKSSEIGKILSLLPSPEIISDWKLIDRRVKTYYFGDAVKLPIKEQSRSSFLGQALNLGNALTVRHHLPIEFVGFNFFETLKNERTAKEIIDYILKQTQGLSELRYLPLKDIIQSKIEKRLFYLNNPESYRIEGNIFGRDVPSVCWLHDYLSHRFEESCGSLAFTTRQGKFKLEEAIEF